MSRIAYALLSAIHRALRCLGRQSWWLMPLLTVHAIVKVALADGGTALAWALQALLLGAYCLFLAGRGWPGRCRPHAPGSPQSQEG